MSNEIVALEFAEMEAHVDQFEAAGAEVVAECGVTVRRLANGCVAAASKLDVLALNRAFGVGLTARPTDEQLDELVETLGRIGSPRFFVQIPPTEAARDVPQRLERRGLEAYNHWMRLRRDLLDLSDLPDPAVRVEAIGPESADTFASIVARAFHLPPSILPLAGCVVGRPKWHHYLAFVGDRPVGSAAMFVTDEAAWFGFAATLEDARGRGAQTALIVRRLRDAVRAGCRWVSVETADTTVEQTVPSFRNLTRLGFTTAYRRPNYLWTRESSTG